MNTATPLILTNGMPRAEDTTIENRLYAVPFNANFSRQTRTIENEEFINIIKEPESLEILFNIAIDISEETIFKYGHFDDFAPECVKQTSANIMRSASSVLLWIDDMVVQCKLLLSDDDLIRIKKSDLYHLYTENFQGNKKGLHAFYEAVRQKYREIKSGGADYFIGIGVVSENNNYDKVHY